jgi:hypothetical protein
MPAYARIADLTQLVVAANPRFRLAASSLAPLFGILNDVNGQAAQVVNAINAIPHAKRARYRRAIYFLAATYPALARHLIHWHAPGRANVAMYTRTALPANYEPWQPHFRRVVPQSALLGRTAEAYLLNTANVGVLIIHMQHVQPGFETLIEGAPVIQHMVSVLSVARELNAPVAVLTQGNPPLEQRLEAVLNGYGNRTNILVAKGHMGGKDPAYIQFATACDSVLVMGFDANVCVFANIFGTMEFHPLPPGSPQGTVPPVVAPLITMCDVVTSRALVVTTNPSISPANHHGEYGPLFNY